MTADSPRWVACSKDASWSASRERHLITPGALTTLCGNSATHPEVWRGNTTKPPCRACEKAALRNREATPVPVEIINRDGVVGEFTVSPEVANLIRAKNVPGWSIDPRRAAVEADVRALQAARPTTTLTGKSGMVWPL